MNKYILLTLLLFNSLILSAQLTDDFSDGDFTNNPTWAGNTDLFQVNAGELQLYDINYISGETYLYVSAPTQGATTWEFKVRMDFNPSSSNDVNVYLNSNQTDLSGSLNGYYVYLGGTDDVVSLRKQSGVTATTIITSAIDVLDVAAVDVSVRVTRDNSNNWELFVDYAGGTNYVSQGTVFDDTYPQGNYFGVFCDYTSTRADKIFFDNIYIDPIFVDNTPPVMTSAMATSATEVVLQFDEPLDAISASSIGNFTINGITIASAMLDSNDPTVVILTLSTPLTSMNTYTVSSDVADISGNDASGTSQNFTFVLIEQAVANDMVINEIMADPTPVQSLPDAEWVEIYNRSNKVFDLADYELSSGSTPQQMPSYILMPNEYVVVTDDGNIGLFTGITNIVAVTSFNALSNAGDNVTLADLSGNVINSVDYLDDWYQDAIKDDGGWTLELINPNSFCSVPSENWIASNDAQGGTPGTVNSVLDNTTGNLTLDMALATTNTIQVTFSQIVDVADATDPANYTVDNGFGSPSSVTLLSDNEVLLTFTNDFSFNTLYTITANNISDCSGTNVIDTNNNSATFQLYEPATIFDIIINEIMADPSPQVGLPETEFIELYNRSNKTINLEGFTLVSGTSTSTSFPFMVLAPDEYMVIYKENPAIDFSSFTGTFLDLPSVPSLSNAGDDISLYDNNGNVIDGVNYDDAWYQDTNKKDGGYTLERINPLAPCQVEGNWIASDDALGGTPSQENSVLDAQVDDQFPDLIDAFPTSNIELVVNFTEALDISNASNPAFYNINNNINVIAAMPVPPLYTSVILTIDPTTAIQENTLYDLTVDDGVTDCLGNPLGMNNSAQFALPAVLEEGDIIINEILFNPYTGGSDFLELYNNSNKIVNIADLSIINDIASTSGSRVNIETDFLLFPQSYVVITEDPANILENYTVEDPNLLIENDLPSFNDGEGNVTLFTEGLVIDKFDYYEDYHFELLDDEEGVSLERIDFDVFTNTRDNWHSAAASAGYATPTYLNSQYLISAEESNDEFSFANETFSPDSDGFEDFIRLDYQVSQMGYVCNIKIYDARGRMVRSLVENEPLGLNGFYQWDGTNDEMTKARIGIYVFWIELFDEAGNITRFKKNCVLAGQF